VDPVVVHGDYYEGRLLVSPRIAAFVEKGLRSEGFATAVAANGNTALEKPLSGEFDLLILDLALPDIDGLGCWPGSGVGTRTSR
jgi:CheY-like chemotaxis protein